MSDSRRLSRRNWQTWLLAGLLLVTLLLCAWLLLRLPGRIAIVGPQKEYRPPAEGEITAPNQARTTKESAAALFATATRLLASPTHVEPTRTASAAVKETALWEQVSRGESLPPISITTLAVDPQDPNKIFAGTHGAGIFVSSDSGKSWSASSGGLGKGTVASIAIDPQNADTIFAGLFDQGGVFKSSDGGQSWQSANNGLDPSSDWNWTAQVAIAPSGPDVLYFSATNSGIYRSVDGGESWNLRSRGCPRPSDLLIDPADSAHVIVPSYGSVGGDCPPGVYESWDGGTAWRQLSSSEMNSQPGSVWWHLAADPKNMQNLTASGGGGTYRTEDGGASWKKIGAACEWLAVDPNDGALFCKQDGRLQRSADQGTSWQSLTPISAPNSLANSPLVVLPGSGEVIVGGERLLKSADDGLSWQSLNRLGSARMRLSFIPAQPGRLYLTAQDKPGGIYRSQDYGKSWQNVLEGIEPAGRLAVTADGTIFYPNPAGQDESIFSSTDSGESWQPLGAGQPIRSPWQITFDPQTENSEKMRGWLVGECGSAIAVTEDGGRTFTLPADSPQDLCQAMLLIDPTGQRLYAIGWGSSYRSEDGGKSWTLLAPASGIFRAAALDRQNPDVVYLGSTHLGVLKTVDGGESWKAVNRGLDNLAVNDLVIDPTEPDTIYAATDGGVFVTTNGGELWNPLGGHPGQNNPVFSLAIDPGDPSWVYVLTAEGIFRYFNQS